jgi:beta-phosphoglucomutase-like phosphatase (HAD superfamily)
MASDTIEHMFVVGGRTAQSKLSLVQVDDAVTKWTGCRGRSAVALRVHIRDGRSVEPDPATYQLPLQRLGLRAERALFVSAHPWDLRAAAEHGYRTANIGRPGADPAHGGELDLSVSDLAALAEAPA